MKLSLEEYIKLIEENEDFAIIQELNTQENNKDYYSKQIREINIVKVEDEISHAKKANLEQKLLLLKEKEYGMELDFSTIVKFILKNKNIDKRYQILFVIRKAINASNSTEGLLYKEHEFPTYLKIKRCIDNNYSLETIEGINIEEGFTITEQKFIEEMDKIIKLRKIRSILITSNLRLVQSIALKNAINNGIDVEDLIQEGNLGLMLSLDKYDYNRETKLDTYATYWIRREIMKANYEQADNIRIPISIKEDMRKINRVIIEYKNNNGKNPTIKEIANELGLSEERIENVYKYMELVTVSIDKIVEGSENTTLEELIEDEEQSVENIIYKKVMRELINELIDNDLTAKEKYILNARIHETKILAELAKEYNVTGERIRQIEKSTIKKLKPKAKMKGLHEFLT